MNSEFSIKDSLGFRLSLACWCILVIAFKEINLVLYPRLWAEEGAIFYTFAAHHSFWAILAKPHIGYYTLFNGIVSALQAKVFQPEAAAWVSTVAGFLVQFIPLLIVLFSNHSLWDNPFKKTMTSCIIIFIVPPELWLNTTNSHFVFGLITFLILITPVCSLSGLERWCFRVLLVLGTLSDPISVFLTPLFLVKWHIKRHREYGIQAGIQLLCSALQAWVILHSLLYDNSCARLQLRDWQLTVQGFFIDHFSLNLVMLSPGVRLILGIIMAAYFAYICCHRRAGREHVYFFAGFIIIALVSTLGSLKMAGAPRYGYVTTCLLMIILFSEAHSHVDSRSCSRIVAMVIFALALTMNGIYYKSRMMECYSPAYPKWKEEVAKWRIDKNYHPVIHPVWDPGKSEWRVNL